MTAGSLGVQTFVLCGSEAPGDDGVDGGLSWTEDGKIVYRSIAGGYPNIWSMAPDGTGQRQLTINSPENRSASVSPAGRYVVWVSHRSNIWRMNVDGSNPKNS